MNPYDLPGLVAELAGGSLFVVGTLLALAGAIRMALAFRRPEKARTGRAAVAGSAVVAIAGIALFYGSQAAQVARACDRAAPWVGAGSVVLAALVAWRVAHRGAPPPEPRVPPVPPAR